MHAANYYNYEGAAALKPALEMMTQLRNFNDHDERACGPVGWDLAALRPCAVGPCTGGAAGGCVLQCACGAAGTHAGNLPTH
jgi:hypothetical protein